MSFEQQMEKLRNIVSRLENKETTLSEGVELYEDGLTLLKDCLKILSESKGKIMLIKKEMDELTNESFD